MDLRETLMNNLETLKQRPLSIQRGVLTMKLEGKTTPIYVVDLVNDPRYEPYVVVYKPHKDCTADKPIKDVEVIEEPITFSSKGSLGQIANQLNIGGNKVRKTIQDRPPIFITPTAWGVNTFNGKEGTGFYEHEPDKLRLTAKDSKVEKGKRTGVFITLDSIKWNKVFTPVGEVLKEFRLQQKLWFDL